MRCSKNLKKHFFTAFSLFLAMLCFCSCQQNVHQSQSESTPSIALAKDRAGNSITLPISPSRIICVTPSSTEILIALGVGENFVAVDNYSSNLTGLPEDITVMDFSYLDQEALLNLAPDLLIASPHNVMGEGDPYAFLNEIGTCVVYIPTSETFEDIYEDISFLGQLVNKPSEANTLIQEMKERVSLVQEKAATVTEKKTVYFEVAPAPTIYTAGSGSFINEMITLAGGINIFASESAWFSPSEEAIITANPDIIFTNTDYIDNALSEIKSREGWTNISAITNNQVYMIDANQSSRPSQFAVEALESLSRLMYPTLYE